MQPTQLTGLLQSACEQHERLRRRFMFTTMPPLLVAGADPDAPLGLQL